MGRGDFRVYLGSAPGVGKTYRMLDEGWRRRERGTDVVIGYVESHDRPLTDAQVRDLEIVPRITIEYRGAQLQEMDVTAVIARRPKVALVDELAHSNAPGSLNEKRWQDVEMLLDAGIDVITTVNIQHLESVNDVVERITGVAQHETVPDVVVRRAEQIELVDLTPEALRRRMHHGNIYKPDKVDAALANYFRVGNLSALRELALLWLADRVEDALQGYQNDYDIDHTWETRERLIVGVTGSPTDECLLRRAARMASRSGATIIAVHVVKADGDRADVDTSVARLLVTEFEGAYREVIDDDAAGALVRFAEAERGTQIVVGASRPRSAFRPLGGIVEKILRLAPSIDIHIVSPTIDDVSKSKGRSKELVSWQREGAMATKKAKESGPETPEAIASLLLSFPSTTEEQPFGPEVDVYKVAGKIFAIMSPESVPPSISLKCDPHRALELRDEFVAVTAGYHLNKTHWNSVALDGSVPAGVLKEMIEHSFDRVIAGMPLRQRKELDRHASI